MKLSFLGMLGGGVNLFPSPPSIPAEDGLMGGQGVPSTRAAQIHPQGSPWDQPPSAHPQGIQPCLKRPWEFGCCFPAFISTHVHPVTSPTQLSLHAPTLGQFPSPGPPLSPAPAEMLVGDHSCMTAEELPWSPPSLITLHPYGSHLAVSCSRKN